MVDEYPSVIRAVVSDLSQERAVPLLLCGCAPVATGLALHVIPSALGFFSHWVFRFNLAVCLEVEEEDFWAYLCSP